MRSRACTTTSSRRLQMCAQAACCRSSRNCRRCGIALPNSGSGGTKFVSRGLPLRSLANRRAGVLSVMGSGCWKSPSYEIRENKIAPGCPTNDFLSFQDIFYPQILTVWEETGLFQHPRDITPTYHGPRRQQPAELGFIIASPLAK